jgi:hypothetical protein
VNVQSKKIKLAVFIKRNGKLYTNKSTIEQYTKIHAALKLSKLKKPPEISNTSQKDLLSIYKIRGNRTGLNLTPEIMSLIKELYKLGIQYKYSEKDFTHD